MGLLWTLRKWIDPDRASEDEARRRARELLAPQTEDGGDDPPVRVVTPPAREFVCRICGHRALETQFCPTCLAGTMRPA